MNKKEAIEILNKLVKTLYETEEFCLEHEKDAEKYINEVNKLIPDNRFTREVLLLLKTCSIAKGERREHLKIAIISDIENEIRKLKENIKEEEFKNIKEE